VEIKEEIQKKTIVNNFDTMDVGGKPETAFMSLKRLAAERGFEPRPLLPNQIPAVIDVIEFCRPMINAE
jgi:hypothetical protein